MPRSGIRVECFLKGTALSNQHEKLNNIFYWGCGIPEKSTMFSRLKNLWAACCTFMTNWQGSLHSALAAHLKYFRFILSACKCHWPCANRRYEKSTSQCLSSTIHCYVTSKAAPISNFDCLPQNWSPNYDPQAKFCPESHFVWPAETNITSVMKK